MNFKIYGLKEPEYNAAFMQRLATLCKQISSLKKDGYFSMYFDCGCITVTKINLTYEVRFYKYEDLDGEVIKENVPSAR
jgi:hypothetical protein